MYISVMTSEIYVRKMSKKDEAFDEEFDDGDGADHLISIEEV